MATASLNPVPFTRHASRDATLFGVGRTLAFDSDGAGLFDVDAITDRSHLHRLFEGAVIVAEIDEFVDFGTIGFDD
jgi:hypothetical protein